MRPIRVTGVTGTSNPVPLDVYATSPAIVNIATGAATIEITVSNVFDLTIVPVWALTPAFVIGTPYVLPMGARAVRGRGLVPADVMEVSQQSIR